MSLTCKFWLSALTVSGLIALLFLSSPAGAQTPVKVGIISPTFGHAPFYVAREKGFFRKEGLLGEVIVMNRDELIMQALVSDSIQFGNISPSALFPAREQGLTNLKMIVGSFNGTTYMIVGQPKFNTLEQLKGAKLAVSSLTAGSTQVLKYILKQSVPARLQFAAGRRHNPALGGVAKPTSRCGDSGRARESHRG
jgi:NitT/TauT family transport system substrate-binding protein